MDISYPQIKCFTRSTYDVSSDIALGDTAGWGAVEGRGNGASCVTELKRIVWELAEGCQMHCDNNKVTCITSGGLTTRVKSCQAM